jgi:integrase
VSDDLVPTNPCRIRGAGASRKVHTTKVATLGELEVITAAMPERYAPMVLLAAWCGLGFGELAELRRGEVDLDARTLRVERAVTSRDGQVSSATRRVRRASARCPSRRTSCPRWRRT